MSNRIHPMLSLRPVRFPSQAGARRTALAAAVTLLAFLPAMLAGGCAGKAKQENTEAKKGTAAVSDTSAYQGAVAIPDTTARVAALRAFLVDYPASRLRAGIYARLLDLLQRKDPAEAASFVQAHLQSEKDPASRGRLYHASYLQARSHDPGQLGAVIDALAKDPTTDADAYNEVAWDLVERHERLDDAVRLASIGVERAADSLSKGSVLDTKGWAQFGQGNFADAVTTLKQAMALSPSGEEQAHLAQAYDKAGMVAEARDSYSALLVSQEDPAVRARVEALTRLQHGSVAEAFAKIDAQRHAAARPAADIALKNYDGREIRLADFRGKVVLLDFWHPT